MATLSALQFVGLFWTGVALFGVAIVFSGLVKCFGLTPVLTMCAGVGLYLTMWGMGIYTVYLICSQITVVIL